jgi:hypothetical protein
VDWTDFRSTIPNKLELEVFPPSIGRAMRLPRAVRTRAMITIRSTGRRTDRKMKVGVILRHILRLLLEKYLKMMMTTCEPWIARILSEMEAGFDVYDQYAKP